MTKVTKNVIVIGRCFQFQVFEEAAFATLLQSLMAESIFIPFHQIENEITDIMFQYYYLKHFFCDRLSRISFLCLVTVYPPITIFVFQ
jgi:hypothetical protein